MHLRWDDRPLDVFARAEALFMGGGNTYALLKRLRESDLLPVIRERVRGGMPYVGASAGSNVAGPAIPTTHDWQVGAPQRLYPPGPVALHINPHHKKNHPPPA